jgi:hypothetical protein
MTNGDPAPEQGAGGANSGGATQSTPVTNGKMPVNFKTRYYSEIKDDLPGKGTPKIGTSSAKLVTYVEALETRHQGLTVSKVHIVGYSTSAACSLCTYVLLRA